jgi:TRL-like protein family
MHPDARGALRAPGVVRDSPAFARRRPLARTWLSPRAMNLARVIPALLAPAALVGCIYSDVHAPLAYRSPTPGDVGGSLGPETQGTACNTAILWLVAFGDGGYDAAVKDAKTNANAVLLADVKADTAYTNILFGVYQRQCTVITARVANVAVAAPPAAPAAPPPGAPGPGPGPAPGSPATPAPGAP